MKKHTWFSCNWEPEDNRRVPSPGSNYTWSFRGSITFKGVKLQPLWSQQDFSVNGYFLCRLMFKIKWTGLLSGRGGGWRQLGEEQTQCPWHVDPFVRAGSVWSRATWTHFINCAESVNFKEIHQRVCYLYMEHFELWCMSSLSCNYSELTGPSWLIV